jgi:hypothetical protein
MSYLLQPTATLMASSVHVLAKLTVRTFPWVGFIIRSCKPKIPDVNCVMVCLPQAFCDDR